MFVVTFTSYPNSTLGIIIKVFCLVEGGRIKHRTSGSDMHLIISPFTIIKYYANSVDIREKF